MPQNLVGARFNGAASSYDKHAWLQQEIGQRLIEKLAILKNHPTRLLDIGQGTGALCLALQNYYRPQNHTVNLFGIDLAYNMCQVAKQKCRPTGWLHKFKKNTQPTFLQADAQQLPFLPTQFDLLVSNCVFQWCSDLPRLFRECHRVLTIHGSLFFTTFGPDSLQELKHCAKQISPYHHAHDFIDMHEIGDILLSCHFTDPIMDMEQITTYYPTLKSLLFDLKKIGATNQHAHRPKGFMTKNWLNNLEAEYEKLRTPQGLPVTWEIVYGHGTKTAPLPTTWQDNKGTVYTSVRRRTVA